MSNFKLAKGAALAALTLAAGLWLSPVQGADEPWKPTGKETPASMKAQTTAVNRPRVPGTYYKATVPDTLDLAERAWLGVNHFTSIISEADDCEMYWRGDFDNCDMWAWPGYMWFQCSPLFACQPKCMEAMAMERLMSGSQQNLEREAGMLEIMASHIGDDGIFYVPPTAGKKPWLGPEDLRPYANVHGQGRMLRAMIAWYQYTGDPAWKERIDRMVDGLDRLMVVHKEDYAYFPTHGWIEEEYLRSCYVKGRGWRDTAEPENEKGGEEGSLFNHQGHIPGALANWYALTGNKQALRLAGELVRFLTKPKFWADWEKGEYPGVVGAEHAHWNGHFHGHINTLRAILEYAVAANDARLKLFVRDGYEWARQAQLARIGLVGDGQGCGCGRLIGLAVKLCDAGAGDYWEDVELYIRNHGSEMQFTPEDIPYLERLLEKNPNPPVPPDLYSFYSLQAKYPQGLPPGTIADRVVGTKVAAVESAVGGFSMAYLPYKSGWALCCSPHGNMGLFYAWEGTIRCSDGVARVNLLLNRASPWMDIESCIPYEGKVVLRNKTAKEAFVRLPLYVETNSVVCRVGDRKVEPRWVDRYLRFERLRPGDVLTIEFPLNETVERWSAGGTVYTMKFKGNTLIEISPPLAPGTWLYQGRAEKYKASKAPTMEVLRYVTDQRLLW